MHRARSSSQLGEEDLGSRRPPSPAPSRWIARRHLLVGPDESLAQDLTRRRVDEIPRRRIDYVRGLVDNAALQRVDVDVDHRVGALELLRHQLDGRDAGSASSGSMRVMVSFPARFRDGISPPLALDLARGDLAVPPGLSLDRPRAASTVGQRRCGRRHVERPDDLVVAAYRPSARRNTAGEELPLAVYAHVEEVLGVVLELDPRSAVRDDLRDEERPCPPSGRRRPASGATATR